MDFRLAKTAVTIFAGVAALGLGSAPAALAAPAGGGTEFVPCNGYALQGAFDSASYGTTLILAPGCTYYLHQGLHTMTRVTIIGHSTTITQARDAGGFTLLTVGNCESANVTVINVNFTGGGGDTEDGGAIYNLNRLTVEGGTFSDNISDDDGGAIENDGQMRVTGATFTHNLAPNGGAILNDGPAIIEGSSFTWNHAPGENAYGGAIYNDDDLFLGHDGFLGNSSDNNAGAIYNEDNMAASHITVTANAAGDDGGGIYNDDNAAVNDSMVFGNQPDNCYNVPGCLG